MLRSSEFHNPRQKADIASIQRLSYVKAESAVPSTFDGSDVIFRPPHEQRQVIGSHVIEFELKESGGSNDVVVCPVQFFITELEIKKNDGNTKCIRSFPEANLFMSCAGPGDEKQTDEYLAQMGLNKSYWTNGRIPAGATRKFYLRLWESDEEWVSDYVGQDRGYTEFTLTLASSVVSSGSGTVGITNIRLLTTDIRMPQKDLATMGFLDVNKTKYRRALWWTEIKETAQTLTASTESEIKLSKIKGKCPFLLLVVRSQSFSSTNSGNHKFVSLGDGALINVKSYDDELLSNGSDLDVRYLKNNIWLEHADSDFNKREMYLIPFCRSAKKAIQGSQTGYWNFDGSQRNVLHITPGPAGTACVQTITITATDIAPNDGGYYKLSFRGDMTDNIAYNATVATIKSALEALPSFQNWGHKPLTVTASATFAGNASTAVTLTFDATNDPPNEDLVQFIWQGLNDGGLATDPDLATSTALTTSGVKGFTTGTYNVCIYAPTFKRIEKTKGVYKVMDD